MDARFQCRATTVPAGRAKEGPRQIAACLDLGGIARIVDNPHPCPRNDAPMFVKP